MQNPVEKGMLLPKGTIICVGHRRFIDETAIDCHIELQQAVKIEGKGSYTNNAVVVRNPRNKWRHDTMSHRICEADYIVSIPSQNNKQASRLLDKEW